MSKKKTKAKRMCLGCGKTMKQKWAACPRCRRPVLAGERVSKSAVASRPTRFAAKAASRIASVVCLNGHTTTPRGSFCSACGIPLGSTVPPMSLVKSNRGADMFWRRELGLSEDPEKREMYWRLAHGQDGGAA